MQARQVSGNRPPPSFAGFDQEKAFGMFDQEAQDRQGIEPLGVAENAHLPADRAAAVPARAQRAFYSDFPRLGCGYSDHSPLLPPLSSHPGVPAHPNTRPPPS